MIRELFQKIIDWRRGTILGAGRSNSWSRVRKNFLKLYDKCEVCGMTKHLEVHHKKSFASYPELELDHNNLITLCRTCHFLFGHLRNWKSWNGTVKEDAKTMLEKIRNRP